MTEEEKIRYHSEIAGSKSEAYYDGQYLIHLKRMLAYNRELNESQIKSLYGIFLKSFKSPVYALQEVKAFVNNKRINKAECE